MVEGKKFSWRGRGRLGVESWVRRAGSAVSVFVSLDWSSLRRVVRTGLEWYSLQIFVVVCAQSTLNYQAASLVLLLCHYDLITKTIQDSAKI